MLVVSVEDIVLFCTVVVGMLGKAEGKTNVGPVEAVVIFCPGVIGTLAEGKEEREKTGLLGLDVVVELVLSNEGAA